MKKISAFIVLNLILLISCANNVTTILNEKAFSLKLDNKWERKYHQDSILLERTGEQLLFQTHYYQKKLEEKEITDTLFKLIEAYRKAEMLKSEDSRIGENQYGKSNDIYMIRFIGNDKSNRFFTVFIFGTPSYTLSAYFEEKNTNQNDFEKRARGIFNNIVLKQ
jgi:hypothetical protein